MTVYHEPRCVFRCALWAVIGALVVLLLLSGCATPPETVTVKVPVPVKAVPPPELTVPFTGRPPVFVAPADSGASSCLTPDGELALKALLLELRTRLQAWEAWGAVDVEDKPP